jgi:hypothetical protein
LQTSNLILDFEFDQHLESHKHVISIIMGFRDTGCYTFVMTSVASLILDFTCFVIGLSFGTFILAHVLVKRHFEAFVTLP